MKSKLFNALLIITSLFGYLEWGKGSKQFLVQVEAEILSKMFTDPMAVFHPFVLLPLLGQIVLLFTLFQKQPGKLLTYIGIGGIGILLLLVFFIACISLNLKMFLSTIPFLLVTFFTIRHLRSKKSK